MLVDDEQMIREVGGRMLEEIGYEVVTAAGGREAVDTCRARGGELHLVILDIIMPEMDGQETFETLRKIIPGLPVLLSSGYSVDEVAGRLLERGAAGFIQKPFSIETLSRRVAEAIASRAPVRPSRRSPAEKCSSATGTAAKGPVARTRASWRSTTSGRPVGAEATSRRIW